LVRIQAPQPEFPACKRGLSCAYQRGLSRAYQRGFFSGNGPRAARLAAQAHFIFSHSHIFPYITAIPYDFRENQDR